MIDRKYIKKIAQSAFRGHRRRVDHLIMHPVREWYCSVALFFIIIALGASWSAQIYLAYRTDASELTAAEVEMVVYRDGLVQLALGIIERRDAEYQAIRARLGNEVVPIEVGATDGESEINQQEIILPEESGVVSSGEEESASSPDSEPNLEAVRSTDSPDSTEPLEQDTSGISPAL